MREWLAWLVTDRTATEVVCWLSGLSIGLVLGRQTRTAKLEAEVNLARHQLRTVLDAVEIVEKRGK